MIGQVGNFSGVAGPVVSPARTALAVWASAVNARGGVACHPVRLYAVDDGGDPARASAVIQDLVRNKHAQALVGNWTVLTEAGMRTAVERMKVPVIGGDLAGLSWHDSPWLFPQGAGLLDMNRGVLEEAVSTGLTKIALLYCVEAAACTVDAKIVPGEAAAAGAQIVYSAPISVTQTDFTAHCQNARAAGAQALRTAVDGSTIGRIARSCAVLGYYPRLMGLSLSISNAQAADPSIRRDGYLVVSPFAPWTLSDSAGQREYLAAMRQFAPDLTPDANSSVAWTSGKLFEAAIARLGASARDKDLTTAAILEGLGRVKGETLGGLVPPITFKAGQQAAARTKCVYVELLTAEGWTTPRGSRRLCF